MSSRISLASLLLLAGLAVAACGGTSAAADPSTPTVSAQPSVAPVSIEPNPVSSTGVSSGSNGSGITISGAVETRVTGAGTCGMDAFTGEDWSATFDNLTPDFDYEADDMWLLSLDVNEYPGAGNFASTKGSTVGKAEIRLSDGMGLSYDSNNGEGSLTIDAGDRSGSIDVMLTDADSGDVIAVKGTWTCDPA